MSRWLTVVVAPDSFKGSATAIEAACAIADGWHEARPDDDVILLPQADGGEGRLAAVAASVSGSRIQSAGLVSGPDGRPTEGLWLELPDGGAFVELAQASGIELLRTLDPLGASTRGLGEVIAHAVSHGIASLTISLGGSASTDGGTGALAALGLGLRDAEGQTLPPGGGALGALATIDRSALVDLPALTLLVDVTSPLLGPRGAATVFGPQKGASPEDVEVLERGLARFAELTGHPADLPGMGAAGGTAFGFAALYDADVVPGADYIAQLTGLREAVERADVVLTGEGRFDEQSLSGKGTGAILAAAAEASTRSGLIAGAVAVDPGVWSVSLSTLAGSTEEALARPLAWLRQAGSHAARELA